MTRKQVCKNNLKIGGKEVYVFFDDDILLKNTDT